MIEMSSDLLRPVRFRFPRGLAIVLLWAAVCGSLGVAAQAPATPGPTKADADRCQQKIDRIAERGVQPRDGASAPQRTVLTEREMNAYLRLVLQAQLPNGVIEPAAVLVGQGQFAVRVVFDLDTVRGQKERGVADPLRYLGGRVPVSMDCVLRTRDGLGTLEFHSATLNGLPVPKFVVQELVVYATRSPDYPEGFRFDEPFRLPANARELQVNRGEAVVIQ
jgi:hypothetical protein